MLEMVLTYIHNWFERETVIGEWTIEGGRIDLPHVQEGQFYRIKGSVFNDGLHRHPDGYLRDETFRGGISALVIPRSLLELVDEIAEWQAKYGEAEQSPYVSESFENYSYSKGTVAGASSNSDLTSGWQREFKGRLIPYRKIED